MIPADQHIWRLSKSGDQNLGLACSEDGLCLGRTPLVERRGDLFLVRAKRDLERLLSRVCGAEIDVERLTFGLTTVASALAAKNLAVAQIAAVHLRLPDLPDAATRAALEAQDLLIKVIERLSGTTPSTRARGFRLIPAGSLPKTVCPSRWRRCGARNEGEGSGSPKKSSIPRARYGRRSGTRAFHGCARSIPIIRT
jgi:hypothetical protein